MSVEGPRGEPMPIAVLVSGGGSNLRAVLEAIDGGSLRARVAVVVSSRGDAGALEHARRHGVPAVVCSPRSFPSREAYDAALVATLRDHGVELVVLAGFMRVVTEVLLEAFPDRVVNVHPSLLPAFPGLHAQAQAFDYGVKVAGCTVHLVDGGVDTGPIIAQEVVDVREGDDAESLRLRILEREHALLPRVLGWFAAGRIVVERREGGRARVRVREAA